ncbi:hypothetical protein AB3R30_26435 [Leptolyngbyaceae cyanobacterium UHCC 1019]
MRLPLLCMALISVLTGCNGTCTSDRCTISSLTSGSPSSPYSSTPPTRYQAIAAQPSSGGFNTPEHAKYKGVKWGGSVSNQEQISLPRENQSAAPLPAVSGFIAPAIVQRGCTTNGAAEYDPSTNTIHVCKTMDADFHRFAIAHETGHAVDWQSDRKFQPDLEYWADQYAVNRLLQEGDCEAIRAKASSSTDIENAYTKGTYYAREMHSAHC